MSVSFNACDLALGTFGDVEYVLLVGVAGGVPHYTDYYKHVRLGDIVVSTPNDKNNLYIFCDDVSVRSCRRKQSFTIVTLVGKVYGMYTVI